MSKKLLSAFTAFVMSMSLAASASAECDGFYMGVRGGIVNHNVGDSDEALGDRLEVDDNAWMAGVALGYRYTYFRAELEYTWREETDKATGEIDARNHSNFQTMSYMLNVYADLTPYSMFTPYVMAGIGMTNIQYEFQGFGRRSVKYEEDNFTWAVGGGLSAKLTNRINIDVGYRFLHMGEIEKGSRSRSLRRYPLRLLSQALSPNKKLFSPKSFFISATPGAVWGAAPVKLRAGCGAVLLASG